MAEPDASGVLETGFPARADAMRAVRDALRARLESWELGPRTAEEVVLAVAEACQNVIRHAYGDGLGAEASDARIELRVENRGDRIVVLIRDYADSVDPGCLDCGRDLDDVRPGGLGTHFMKECMDEVGFDPTPAGGGNLLRMTKRI